MEIINKDCGKFTVGLFVFLIICGLLSLPFLPAATLSNQYACVIDPAATAGNRMITVFSCSEEYTQGTLCAVFSKANCKTSGSDNGPNGGNILNCNWGRSLVEYLNYPVLVGISFSALAALCLVKFIPAVGSSYCVHVCIKEDNHCCLSEHVAGCCCNNGWLAFLGTIFSTVALIMYSVAYSRQEKAAAGNFPPTLPGSVPYYANGATWVGCAFGATSSQNMDPKTMIIVAFVGLGIMLLAFSSYLLFRIGKYFKALLDSRNSEIATEKYQARTEVEPLLQQARDGSLAKNTTTAASSSINYDYNATTTDSDMSLGYQEATNPSFSVSVEAGDTESSSVNESVLVDLPPTRRNLSQQQEE